MYKLLHIIEHRYLTYSDIKFSTYYSIPSFDKDFEDTDDIYFTSLENAKRVGKLFAIKTDIDFSFIVVSNTATNESHELFIKYL